MFNDPETFMNSNTDLFNGLTEDDLLLPEKLVFFKNEVIQATILDASIVEKIGAVKVEVKVETGDHTGKLHEFLVFKPKAGDDGKISPMSKKNWVNFLLALFTKEAILAGQIDFTKHVGTKIEFKAGEAKSKGDKTYQNFSDFKLVEAAPF
jgi:hypothetical protein